jgi:GT2 family glycosyltransferase
VKLHRGLVTVVIVNYNRINDLFAALQSVREQDYSDVETIVVDNASTDNSVAMVAKQFPEVQVIELKQNIGFGGYSEGFQIARGEFIFQMDNDSLMPDTTVLSEVVNRFQQGPSNLAAVATRVEEYRAGVDRVEDLRQRDEHSGPIDTGGFHAGGVGFRRSLLDKVGYYNEDIFLYGSESFLLMKILAAGYQILYHPEVLMLHKSSAIERSSSSLYYEIRNRYWFLRYFGNRSQQLRFMPGLLLYDLVYGLSKKRRGIVVKALWDGLGELPASLHSPVRSSRPRFSAKVKEFGEQYGFFRLLERIKSGRGN